MINKKYDSFIAASVTFLVALLLLLALFFCYLSFDNTNLTASTPNIEQMEEEELFIEPEIIEDLGEPDAVEHDQPAPAFNGTPEQAETENTKLVVPGKNDKPAPPVAKPISQQKESPVKATEPSKTNEEKKTVTSKMSGKFSSQNGSENGKSGNNGAGGVGVGIAGSVSGRTFIGCPSPKVELQNKVVVVVNVTINSEGKVTKATARSKSGKASDSILRACERAARSARWTEDKATPSATGSITFTITPK